MTYPIDIMKERLKEAEHAQSLCLLAYNKDDYLKIENEVVIPIKTTLRLLDMAINVNLFKTNDNYE
ncbi:conserved protein of unknown function [Tenacibaculum sp. 190524A02b]|uniref:hypothetical protein n=1 Tax=Tenacibaculum vairaonense TaxID=3137860 RepID=UPI0032B239C0